MMSRDSITAIVLSVAVLVAVPVASCQPDPSVDPPPGSLAPTRNLKDEGPRSRLESAPQGAPRALEQVRAIISDEKENGVIAMARIAKAHLYTRSGRDKLAASEWSKVREEISDPKQLVAGQALLAELRALTEEARAPDLVVAAHAIVVGCDVRQGRVDEALAVLDGLISLAKSVRTRRAPDSEAKHQAGK